MLESLRDDDYLEAFQPTINVYQLASICEGYLI